MLYRPQFFFSIHQRNWSDPRRNLAPGPPTTTIILKKYTYPVLLTTRPVQHAATEAEHRSRMQATRTKQIADDYIKSVKEEWSNIMDAPQDILAAYPVIWQVASEGIDPTSFQFDRVTDQMATGIIPMPESEAFQALPEAVQREMIIFFMKGDFWGTLVRIVDKKLEQHDNCCNLEEGDFSLWEELTACMPSWYTTDEDFTLLGTELAIFLVRNFRSSCSHPCWAIYLVPMHLRNAAVTSVAIRLDGAHSYSFALESAMNDNECTILAMSQPAGYGYSDELPYPEPGGHSQLDWSQTHHLAKIFQRRAHMLDKNSYMLLLATDARSIKLIPKAIRDDEDICRACVSGQHFDDDLFDDLPSELCTRELFELAMHATRDRGDILKRVPLADRDPDLCHLALESDDWSAFETKLADIDAAREALDIPFEAPPAKA